MFDRKAYDRERLKKHAEKRKRSYTKRRDDVLKMYGGRCSCCGVEDLVFLALDHVQGGGSKFRREHDSRVAYRLALEEYQPELFQILCHNCNWAKSHGGCPHKVQRD